MYCPHTHAFPHTDTQERVAPLSRTTGSPRVCSGCASKLRDGPMAKCLCGGVNARASTSCGCKGSLVHSSLLLCLQQRCLPSVLDGMPLLLCQTTHLHGATMLSRQPQINGPTNGGVDTLQRDTVGPLGHWKKGEGDGGTKRFAFVMKEHVVM